MAVTFGELNLVTSFLKNVRFVWPNLQPGTDHQCICHYKESGKCYTLLAV